MTAAPRPAPPAARRAPLPELAAPQVALAVAFLALYGPTLVTLARSWLTVPAAGHGLLVAPVAVWLAWREGMVASPRPARGAGLALLAGAVLLEIAGIVAGAPHLDHLSLVLALAALAIHFAGWAQLRRWWLPMVLLVLSMPVPETVSNWATIPLQQRASVLGAALLSTRHIPVRLEGNVIALPPDHLLFVSEACSGLRSLTALIALAVLVGGVRLRTPLARVALAVGAVPLAVLVNGVRVFLTGFLVYFVSPALGEGFLHLTEGWLLFIVSLLLLLGMALVMDAVEERARPGMPRPAHG